jgi:hypothetical protein
MVLPEIGIYYQDWVLADALGILGRYELTHNLGESLRASSLLLLYQNAVLRVHTVLLDAA